MNQFCGQQFYHNNNGYKYQHFYNAQNPHQTEIHSVDHVDYSSAADQQIQLYHSHQQQIEMENQRLDCGSGIDNGLINIENMEKYDNNCVDGFVGNGISGSHNGCFEISNEWITSQDRCDVSSKTRTNKSECEPSMVSSDEIRVTAISTTGSKEIFDKINADVMARWLTYGAISSKC